VAEARQRLAALYEQARKDADDKAWADAEKAGTAAAYTGYVQKFGSGAHAAEARQRLAALDEQARKDADEKAWADAEKAGTASAYTGYVQKFGSGAHVAEARQRLAALDEQARKDADEKAWADAEKAGTAAAYTGYVQKFGSGAHVAEARQRVATLETQGRREVPSIDIQKTCQAAAGAMVSLMGGTTTEQDVNACLDSEQKARDQIVKDRATYSAADKKQCMRTDNYLPSYVEWLTCLEMERDVRKMERPQQFGAGPWTLPKVRPAINTARR
jgi:putative transposon-encoded protein